MVTDSPRLEECPDCGRLFNAQVTRGRCPKCGTEIKHTP